jgi:hypothetical protein
LVSTDVRSLIARPDSLTRASRFVRSPGLSMSVGATYLKAAIEDDDSAASTLVFTRLTIGILNMVIASRSHCVNYIYGAIEIVTALLFMKTLDAPAGKKTRKQS